MPKLFFRSLILAAALAGTAQAQDTEASQAQDLSNCAGVVAAVSGNLDPRTHPQGARGEWAPVLTAILARLHTEEGMEGMTGREAARAAQHDWAEQPRAAREAAANQCAARYGSN